LRLNDNRILEVPDYAFDGISRNLREIHLERNVILDIGPFAFRGLPALKYLNLAENQLSEVPTAALFFTTPPDLVNLSRNRIVVIDSEAFVDPAFPSNFSYIISS
jgi:Leucine-rich repeat (LRR) protein